MTKTKKLVALFVGTRPEGIKMAPVARALRSRTDVDCVVVSTGQHREMLDQVLELFAVPVGLELSIMRPDQTLASVTARALEAVDGALEKLRPDFAVVQGDTTTVLSTSLAAFYRGVPVGHVEAGLRSHDLAAPFPEEANRVLASRLSTLHFAPTEGARAHLLAEGISADRIQVTGNTVIDALQMEVARQKAPAVREELERALSTHLGRAPSASRYVLVTGHRRESFGDGFGQICRALAELSERFEDVQFVYPVHLNPNVQGPVREHLSHRPNIHLLPPLPYSELVFLLAGCELVLTDSGGIQEEAPGLGKPTLVMRDVTERPEGVAAGTAMLVGTDPQRIVGGVAHLLTDRQAYDAMAQAKNPYGDGQAGERVAASIAHYLHS